MQNFTERQALVGTIDPSSQGVGELLSAAIPLAQLRRLVATIQTGVLGASATVDAVFKGATSSGGSYTAIPGAAIVQIVKASGDNKQAQIEIDTKAIENLLLSYTHVKLSMTVGTAASLTAANVYADRARYGDATLYDQAGLVQKVTLLN